MDKLDGKVNSFWLFITLETNVILTMRVNCGLKVLLWVDGAGRVLEELELKPTQPPTAVGLGLSLAISMTDHQYDQQTDWTYLLGLLIGV